MNFVYQLVYQLINWWPHFIDLNQFWKVNTGFKEDKIYFNS